MRVFELTYILRGVERVETFKCSTNTLAVSQLMAKLSRLDRLFFKLVKISIV